MNIYENRPFSHVFVDLIFVLVLMRQFISLVISEVIIVMFQVSFLLGVIPIFVAWVYSEFLEYQKSPPLSKA